jgi:bacterioferritin
MYNEAAVICAEEKDQISKQLFEKLLEDEEEHFSIFENIKDHVDRLGAKMKKSISASSKISRIMLTD